MQEEEEEEGGRGGGAAAAAAAAAAVVVAVVVPEAPPIGGGFVEFMLTSHDTDAVMHALKSSVDMFCAQFPTDEATSAIFVPACFYRSMEAVVKHRDLTGARVLFLFFLVACHGFLDYAYNETPGREESVKRLLKWLEVHWEAFVGGHFSHHVHMCSEFVAQAVLVFNA